MMIWLILSLVCLCHRRSLSTGESRLAHFQATFPYAGKQQGGLSLIALASSIYSWYSGTEEEKKCYFLANAGLLLALTVWTFAVILPINLQLIDGTSKKCSICIAFKLALPLTDALKKGESWLDSLLSKWAATHHVRTLGGLICVGCVVLSWL